MIWIIGGTSEARTLIGRLRGRKDFIVSVATYSGAEVLDGQQPVIGRLDYAGMVNFIREKSIDTVVDMSHPYALEVTKNARAASETTGAGYIRFSRRSSDPEGCVFTASAEQCASYLEGLKGCVFFTTGTKDIRAFERVRGGNRFVYRVLPTAFSIRECMENGIRMEDIIAILGPVSEELNHSMFKAYKADYVVMKDSGEAGGTREKINACMRLGITSIVIQRQEEEKGVEDMEELLRLLLKPV